MSLKCREKNERLESDAGQQQWKQRIWTLCDFVLMNIKNEYGTTETHCRTILAFFLSAFAKVNQSQFGLRKFPSSIFYPHFLEPGGEKGHCKVDTVRPPIHSCWERRENFGMDNYEFKMRMRIWALGEAREMKEMQIGRDALCDHPMWMLCEFLEKFFNFVKSTLWQPICSVLCAMHLCVPCSSGSSGHIPLFVRRGKEC